MPNACAGHFAIIELRIFCTYCFDYTTHFCLVLPERCRWLPADWCSSSCRSWPGGRYTSPRSSAPPALQKKCRAHQLGAGTDSVFSRWILVLGANVTYHRMVLRRLQQRQGKLWTKRYGMSGKSPTQKTPMLGPVCLLKLVPTKNTYNCLFITATQ